MLKLIGEFIWLFALKQKPQNIPYSKVLVGVLVFCFAATSIPINILLSNFLVQHSKVPMPLVPLNFSHALVIFCGYVLVMWLSIYGILAFYDLRNRFIQTVSSLLGIEVILSLLFGALLIIPLSPLTVILFILLLYWQFMVHIHIFSNSFSFTILKAGLFALIYILLQHNIGEILLNTFMIREI